MERSCVLGPVGGFVGGVWRPDAGSEADASLGLGGG